MAYFGFRLTVTKKSGRLTPTFIFKNYLYIKNLFKMKDVMKWKELSIKDRVSYYTAFSMIASGIILAFLSFFLNAFNIATGVLIYIAQCFVIGGGLVGANVYFKSKWVEFDTRAKNEIERQIQRLKQ